MTRPATGASTNEVASNRASSSRRRRSASFTRICARVSSSRRRFAASIPSDSSCTRSLSARLSSLLGLLARLRGLLHALARDVAGARQSPERGQHLVVIGDPLAGRFDDGGQRDAPTLEARLLGGVLGGILRGEARLLLLEVGNERARVIDVIAPTATVGGKDEVRGNRRRDRECCHGIHMPDRDCSFYKWRAYERMADLHRSSRIFLTGFIRLYTASTKLQL